MNMSSCPSANITTWAANPANGDDWHYNITISPPMPGIIPYPKRSPYSHWTCEGNIYATDWFDLQTGNITGVCQAGSKYVWGFSFLLTFVVSILTFVFAVMMYALWLDTRGAGLARDHSAFKDAVEMVTQAQTQYGEQIDEWTAGDLQKKVMRGSSGMTADSVKRRRTAYEDVIS